MAALYRTAASLRVFGDDLEPEEVSRLLGCEPSAWERRGQRIIGGFTGNVRIATTGSWRLSAVKRVPGNLDAQIDELLSKVSQDLGVWKDIADRFRVDLFCGLFMDGPIEGISVSASSLASLGSRGIELVLDIYGSEPGDT